MIKVIVFGLSDDMLCSRRIEVTSDKPLDWINQAIKAFEDKQVQEMLMTDIVHTILAIDEDLMTSDITNVWFDEHYDEWESLQEA